MAFQRSYSKVWWGSDDSALVDDTFGIRIKNHAHQPIINNKNHNIGNSNAGLAYGFTDLYSSIRNNSGQRGEPKTKRQQKPMYAMVQQPGYHTLTYKCFGGNLSCIKEVANETSSPKLTWSKHNSPRSLRSLDSGFSDNEEYLGGRSSKPVSPSRHSLRSAKSDFNSPTSIHSIATPPTVIRRTGRSKFYTPLVNVSRHMSFNTSRKKNSIHIENTNAKMDYKVDDVLQSINLTSSKSYEHKHIKNLADSEIQEKTNKFFCKKLKPVSLMSPNMGPTFYDSFEWKEEINDVDLTDSTSHFKDYKNETVYLRSNASRDSTLLIPPYNNETVLLGRSLMESSEENDVLSPLRLSKNSFKCKTSTPKLDRRPTHLTAVIINGQTFLNVGQPIQRWLTDLRLCYEHEVMSTLQTKSIVQEAFKNLTITTNTVAKLIRQLQQKSLHIQTSFERVANLIIDEQRSLSEALNGSMELIKEVQEFLQILQRRGVFFADSHLDHRRYEAHLYQIHLVAKDTRYSVEHQHYINMESLLEDIEVLKRNLLIALRQVYVKLLYILIQSIEQNNRGGNDLMLRANINMIATIMNIDYDGLASLTDAFVQTGAVRTLLLVCLDHRLSSVRAMALRALATICSTSEPIAQLSSCGGIEILRDILQVHNVKDKDTSLKVKRSEMEKREAVSLLTQITAHWHGPNHKVNGLRTCLESLVEGVTDLLIHTECSETLLLCAAALNNLSRMEITTHYSIMSHETIFKLIEAINKQINLANDDKGVSIFLYDQIFGMLQNMSQNKKCHSHLANADVINFITYTYQTEFYKCYSSRCESEAQWRTIKCILYTLTRLTQDSVLGMKLLEQQKHMLSAVMFFKNYTNDKEQPQQQQPMQQLQQLSPAMQQQQEKQNSLDNYNYCISSLAHQVLQKEKEKQKQGQEQYQHHKQHQSQQQSQQEQQHRQSNESMKEPENLNAQFSRQESYV